MFQPSFSRSVILRRIQTALGNVEQRGQIHVRLYMFGRKSQTLGQTFQSFFLFYHSQRQEINDPTYGFLFFGQARTVVDYGVDSFAFGPVKSDKCNVVLELQLVHPTVMFPQHCQCRLVKTTIGGSRRLYFFMGAARRHQEQQVQKGKGRCVGASFFDVAGQIRGHVWSQKDG